MLTSWLREVGMVIACIRRMVHTSLYTRFPIDRMEFITGKSNALNRHYSNFFITEWYCTSLHRMSKGMCPRPRSGMMGKVTITPKLKSSTKNIYVVPGITMYPVSRRYECTLHAIQVEFPFGKLVGKGRSIKPSGSNHYMPFTSYYRRLLGLQTRFFLVVCEIPDDILH